MGRYYKIILSLVIAIFMVTGTISAYEGTDVNLISVTNLLKKTQDVKSKKINLCNLKIDKEGHTNLCVQDVATSDNKSINKNI